MKPDDTQKTLIAVRLTKSSRDTMRQILQLIGLLLGLVVLCAIIGAIQYHNCHSDNPELTVMQCLKTGKLKR